LPVIAYIANEFPSAVEWYVVEEILELRRRGVRVIPCSARRPREDPALCDFIRQTLYLQPLSLRKLCRAARRLIRQRGRINDLLARILFRGNESTAKRIRALLHTLLGAYYADQLQTSGVDHIHVHHGYFASWIALVAARLLGISFSMTLHGSDLLLHGNYLDAKLAECSLCVTISEFNRKHLLARYPTTRPDKIRVQRLGVRVKALPLDSTRDAPGKHILLAVGRLHAVKNYPFLVHACFHLREAGFPFHCFIAGEGPERRRLESLIEDLNLRDAVTLLGHIPRDQIARYYHTADLVVLTSHSEGIPLVLMEAMAQRNAVLAPAITGIPELVIAGETGFLYSPGNIEEFVHLVIEICSSVDSLDRVRRAALARVQSHFNQETNVRQFAELLLGSVSSKDAVNSRSYADANSVLQQI
jgi:glycosyltransferase involved in cell wall biosynthesis